MKPLNGDRVAVDGQPTGTVIQDGCTKSLIAEGRSDGQAGWQQEWYENSRLTVLSRRSEQLTGEEPTGFPTY